VPPLFSSAAAFAIYLAAFPLRPSNYCATGADEDVILLYGPIALVVAPLAIWLASSLLSRLGPQQRLVTITRIVMAAAMELLAGAGLIAICGGHEAAELVGRSMSLCLAFVTASAILIVVGLMAGRYRGWFRAPGAGSST